MRNNIGKKLYGYCNGFFGRDDYDTKVIVYETPTSIACIYLDNEDICCANFDSEDTKNRLIEEWNKNI